MLTNSGIDRDQNASGVDWPVSDWPLIVVATLLSMVPVARLEYPFLTHRAEIAQGHGLTSKRVGGAADYHTASLDAQFEDSKFMWLLDERGEAELKHAPGGSRRADVRMPG
jgi:hypothetical protein